MSYLNPLRLHFYGNFQAAVSTVNNDPTHFNNATFKPAYQQRQSGQNANGWWNPRGDANWRMLGCNITSAWLDGKPAQTTDPVLTCLIADSDQTVAAKLVDLDPAQQGVSEIWGMEIRIANQDGHTLMRAKYKVAAFIDLFERVFNGGPGDQMGSAMYQSVLTDIEWGEIGDSPFLQALRKAASNGLLSIKFNVDAFDDNFQSPTFTIGRVAGTIGPAADDEPRHFVSGRHLMTTAGAGQGFFVPAGNVNFCPARVDEAAGKIYLDLGNSLCTQTAGGPFQNLGPMALASVTTDDAGNPKYVPIGNVDYLADGWYSKTAAVAVLPENRKLTEDELKTIAQNPLAILFTPTSGAQPTPAIAEPPSGLYIRADQFVFRLNPGESAEVDLYATQFGAPLPGARVINFLDDTQIGGGPPVGVPETTLDFPRSLVLDKAGRARLKITAGNPGNPRKYIDGQVYGIRCTLEDTLAPALEYPFDPNEVISLLVWDKFTPEQPVTWYGSLQPIFQQYANLYPIMSRFVDLSDYKSVVANRQVLSVAFGLGFGNPNYMPVTRDLSGDKQKAILDWLRNPLEGMPPGAPAQSAKAQGSADVSDALPGRGGKAAFYSRLQLRRKRQ